MDRVQCNFNLRERQEIFNTVTPEYADFLVPPYVAYIMLPHLYPHSQGHRTHFCSDDMKILEGVVFPAHTMKACSWRKRISLLILGTRWR